VAPRKPGKVLVRPWFVSVIINVPGSLLIHRTPLVHFPIVSNYVSSFAFSEYFDKMPRGIRCRIRDDRQPGSFPGKHRSLARRPGNRDPDPAGKRNEVKLWHDGITDRSLMNLKT
jgi:hypothetical protein